MNKLILFGLIIAWPFAIWYTFCWVIRVGCLWKYTGSIEQRVDNITGKVKHWNLARPFTFAFVLWTYIIIFS